MTETSTCAPVCHNHAFPPSLTDNIFSLWKNKGIVTIADLYINIIATFVLLKESTHSQIHIFLLPPD